MIRIPLISHISRLQKRERVIFYVTAGIILLMLLDRFVLSQILEKIHQMDRRIRSQEEAIRNSIVITTQEERIIAESKIYAPYFSDPESEEKEINIFLKEIENYAKDSSVYLVDIKPSGKKEKGLSRQYFLKLEFEALMEQVFNFLYVIENSGKKILTIESYQIAPKTTGSSIVTCSMSISKVIVPK